MQVNTLFSCSLAFTYVADLEAVPLQAQQRSRGSGPVDGGREHPTYWDSLDGHSRW